MKYRHLRNATALLDYGGITLLVDPWFADEGSGASYSLSGVRSPTVPLPIPPEEAIAQADAVLLTHMHEDHFDAAAKALLPRHLPVLCTLPLVSELKLLGFEQVVPLEPGTDYRGVTFAPVMAQHGPPHVLYRMGHVVGYLLRHDAEPGLYLAGDTILSETVRATILQEQPDVIVVNAGGAFSRGRDGPIIMDERDVEAALRLAPRARVIAVHLEATDHGRVTRAGLRAVIDAAGADLSHRLTIPADGESVVLDQSP